MRTLRRLAWAGVIAAATAGPAAAQFTGGTGGGTTTTGGGGTTLGGTGGTTTGSTGSTGSTSANNGMSAQLPSVPTIAPPSSYATQGGGGAAGGVQASNFLGPYYGAVYYQGLLSNAMTHSPPGGFGTALYPATGTAAGGRGGVGGAAGLTGTTGLTGGLGGAGGRGGIGGATATNVGGVIVPLPRAIAYSAQVRFAAPPVPPPQIQANLRGVIDRTPGLANPAGVSVVVDGNTVALRGSVRDEEEARLVEGLVRLTPGVGLIKNELAFPRP